MSECVCVYHKVVTIYRKKEYVKHVPLSDESFKVNFQVKLPNGSILGGETGTCKGPAAGGQMGVGERKSVRPEHREQDREKDKMSWTGGSG